MKSSTSKPSHPSDGDQQHKALPSQKLAHWSPDRRKRTPQDLLNESMHDRVPALAAIKNERMAASPFGFFRGAVPVMAYDLSLDPHTGIFTQLCGDAHVQNLGAYAGPDGRLIFDINDFDETTQGPFEWDVKRMATSIVLAGQAAKIKTSAARRAAELFLDAYCELMQQLASMPILAVARFQVHRLADVGPISKVLMKAQRETPARSFDRLTEKHRNGRVFRSNGPLLRPLEGREARSVLSSLAAYSETLLPERRHFFRRFRPLAVAFKVVGTGSVGLRDYCMLLEGNGPKDPLFLQIKQENPSAYAAYLPEPSPPCRNEGQRTAEGQRAMQLSSDPLLGWTTIEGRGFLVRQLNDHKAAVDVTTLKNSGLSAYAAVCGELLARGHARAGDAGQINDYLGNGRRFKQSIHSFACAYAGQTVADWKLFVSGQPTHDAKKKHK